MASKCGWFIKKKGKKKSFTAYSAYPTCPEATVHVLFELLNVKYLVVSTKTLLVLLRKDVFPPAVFHLLLLLSCFCSALTPQQVHSVSKCWLWDSSLSEECLNSSRYSLITLPAYLSCLCSGVVCTLILCKFIYKGIDLITFMHISANHSILCIF